MCDASGLFLITRRALVKPHGFLVHICKNNLVVFHSRSDTGRRILRPRSTRIGVYLVLSKLMSYSNVLHVIERRGKTNRGNRMRDCRLLNAFLFLDSLLVSATGLSIRLFLSHTDC